MAQYQFDVLSDTEVVEIKEATFRLRERTGCRIYSPEARVA